VCYVLLMQPMTHIKNLTETAGRSALGLNLTAGIKIAKCASAKIAVAVESLDAKQRRMQDEAKNLLARQPVPQITANKFSNPLALRTRSHLELGVWSVIRAPRSVHALYLKSEINLRAALARLQSLSQRTSCQDESHSDLVCALIVEVKDILKGVINSRRVMIHGKSEANGATLSDKKVQAWLIELEEKLSALEASTGFCEVALMDEILDFLNTWIVHVMSEYKKSGVKEGSLRAHNASDRNAAQGFLLCWEIRELRDIIAFKMINLPFVKRKFGDLVSKIEKYLLDYERRRLPLFDEVA
jgi:hypothetical protein